MVSGEFKSNTVFQAIEDAFKSDGGRIVPKVQGVFCFNVTDGPNGAKESWIVDAKNGNGSVTKGAKAKADVTITIADSDFLDLMIGTLNPQKAFFQGKLKIKGNMGLAMKMQEFQQLKAKL